MSLQSMTSTSSALAQRPMLNQNSRQKAISRRAVAANAARNTSPASESLGMLEAFFIGRALAETVNERLGSAAGDLLAEVGKFEAEFRRSVQDFQDEVMARAQREMTAAAGDSGMGGGSSSGSRGALAGPADLGESIDNLRAEVASARVLVQQVKQKPALLR